MNQNNSSVLCLKRNVCQFCHMFLYTVLLAFCIAPLGAWAADPTTIIRVDPINGNDNFDGSEWTDFGDMIGPMQTLNAAICAVSEAGGGQVWARQGLYKPMTSQIAIDADGSTITLIAVALKSNVKVYGGFAGAETSLEERSEDPKLTIIDGSMADGGSAGFHTVAIVNVVNTCLSGFLIQGGSAATFEELNDTGGGIIAVDADGTNVVENCVVTCNNAVSGGGIGIYTSDLLITRCHVSFNAAQAVVVFTSAIRLPMLTIHNLKLPKLTSVVMTRRRLAAAFLLFTPVP